MSFPGYPGLAPGGHGMFVGQQPSFPGMYMTIPGGLQTQQFPPPSISSLSPFPEQHEIMVPKQTEDTSAVEDVYDDNGKRIPRRDEVPVEADVFYNLDRVLAEAILKSVYFKSLFELRTYHEVLEEIKKEVDYLEPYIPNLLTTPSSAFTLLYKLFTMHLTHKQLNGMLRNSNVYIRALGVLYLRLTLPPGKLWDYLSDYLGDTMEISADQKHTKKEPFGKWIVGLLTDNRYFTIFLPRLPMSERKNLEEKLVEHGYLPPPRKPNRIMETEDRKRRQDKEREEREKEREEQRRGGRGRDDGHDRERRGRGHRRSYSRSPSSDESSRRSESDSKRGRRRDEESRGRGERDSKRSRRSRSPRRGGDHDRHGERDGRRDRRKDRRHSSSESERMDKRRHGRRDERDERRDKEEREEQLEKKMETLLKARMGGEKRDEQQGGRRKEEVGREEGEEDDTAALLRQKLEKRRLEREREQREDRPSEEDQRRRGEAKSHSRHPKSIIQSRRDDYRFAM